MKFGDLYKQAKEAGALAAAVLPDGDFIIKCVSANAKEKDNGDQMGFLFEVVSESDGTPLDDGDEAKGAKGWINLYFTEKAAPISIRQLKSFGLSDEFLDTSDKIEDVAQAVVGVVLDASVGHRNWGKDGDQVSNTIEVNEVLVAPAAVGAAVEVEDASSDPTEVVDPY